MKNRNVRLIAIVAVVVLIAGCGTKMEDGSGFGLEGLGERKGWNETFERGVIPDGVFVYRHITRDWGGRQSSSRRRVPSNTLWADSSAGREASRSPGGLLSLMQEPSRVREVKAIASGTGGLIIENGFEVMIGGKDLELDAKGICQMQGRLPLRFTFDAIIPDQDASLNPWVHKLQAVYKWGDHPVGSDSLWVPVEIVLEVVISQNGVLRRRGERWVLSGIVGGSEERM